MNWKNVRGKDKALLENFKGFSFEPTWVDSDLKSLVVTCAATGERFRVAGTYGVDFQIVEPPKMVERWRATGAASLFGEDIPISKDFEFEYEAQNIANQLNGGKVEKVQVPEA